MTFVYQPRAKEFNEPNYKDGGNVYFLGGTGDIAEDFILMLAPKYKIYIGSRKPEEVVAKAKELSAIFEKAGISIIGIEGLPNDQAVEIASQQGGIVIPAVPVQFLLTTLKPYKEKLDKPDVLIISLGNNLVKRQDGVFVIAPLTDCITVDTMKELFPELKVEIGFPSVACAVKAMFTNTKVVSAFNNYKAHLLKGDPRKQISLKIGVISDDAEAKRAAMDLISAMPGLTPFDAGSFEECALLEELTAASVNSKNRLIREWDLQNALEIVKYYKKKLFSLKKAVKKDIHKEVDINLQDLLNSVFSEEKFMKETALRQIYFQGKEAHLGLEVKKAYRNIMNEMPREIKEAVIRIFNKRIEKLGWSQAIDEYIRLNYSEKSGYTGMEKIIDIVDHSIGWGVYKFIVKPKGALSETDTVEFFVKNGSGENNYLKNEFIWFELQKMVLGIDIGFSPYLHTFEDGKQLLIMPVIRGESANLAITSLLKEKKYEQLKELFMNYMAYQMVLGDVFGRNDRHLANTHINMADGAISLVMSFDNSYFLDEPNFDWTEEDISEGMHELNLVTLLPEFYNDSGRKLLFKEIEDRYIKTWKQINGQKEAIGGLIKSVFGEEGLKKISILEKVINTDSRKVMKRHYRSLFYGYGYRIVYRKYLTELFDKYHIKPVDSDYRKYCYLRQEDRNFTAVRLLECFRGVLQKSDWTKNVVVDYNIKDRATTLELYENIRGLIKKYAGEKKVRELYKELDNIRDMADKVLQPDKIHFAANTRNKNNIVDGIHNACDERWNALMELMSRSDDKERIAALIDKFGKGTAIIELGCGGGAIISILEKKFPEAQIFGVDYNGYMIKSALKNHPKTTFFVRDIVHWGDFYLFENKFDAVIIGSTLHEIVSFSDKDDVIEADRNVFKMANKMLEPGGILVGRDGLGPDNGDIWAAVRFKTDFSRRQFFRFAEDFMPWKVEYTVIDGNSVNVRRKDLYEYLIKYIYDKPYSWQDEMKEAFGKLTHVDYLKSMKGLFEIEYCDRYTLPFFNDKWNEDLEITGEGLPNSHILFAARKIAVAAKPAQVVKPVETADILVIGSGLAGCSAAMSAAAGENTKVIMVTKGLLPDTNTYNAQAGINAALGKDDTVNKHVMDTLGSGDGLCEEELVRILVAEGIVRVEELIELGLEVDRDKNGQIQFGKEAHASGASRVVKAGDATGRKIQEFVLNYLAEMKNLEQYEKIFITELIIDNGRCVGAKGIDLTTGKEVKFFANAVILATGGMGQVYWNNSNPTFATADGISLAQRVGAIVERMRFVQFHPTTLVTAGKRGMPSRLFPHTPTNFLISEAVRGAGAMLLNNFGEQFMFNYHPKGEMATRDIVSRGIWQEMLKTNADFVWLDARGIANFREEFGVIYARCIENGFDPTKELIPVAPAAHYAMGGVYTDSWGRTSIKGLYAAGEVASTRVHGANRLASNSLLEALVFGRRAGQDALVEKETLSDESLQQIINKYIGSESSLANEGVIKRWDRGLWQIRESIQKIMWENVGIIRTTEGLNKAKEALNKLENDLKAFPFTVEKSEIENVLVAARLVTEDALAHNTEKIGAHWMENKDGGTGANELDGGRAGKTVSPRIIPSFSYRCRLDDFNAWFLIKYPLARGNFGDFGIGITLNNQGIPSPETTLKFAKDFPALTVYGIDKIIPYCAVRLGVYWGIFDKKGRFLKGLRQQAEANKGYFLEDIILGENEKNIMVDLFRQGAQKIESNRPQRIFFSPGKVFIYKPFELAKQAEGVSNVVFIQSELGDLKDILKNVKFDFGRVFNTTMHYDASYGWKIMEGISNIFKENGIIVEGQEVYDLKLIFTEYKIKNRKLLHQEVWFPTEKLFTFEPFDSAPLGSRCDPNKIFRFEENNKLCSDLIAIYVKELNKLKSHESLFTRNFLIEKLRGRNYKVIEEDSLQNMIGINLIRDGGMENYFRWEAILPIKFGDIDGRRNCLDAVCCYFSLDPYGRVQAPEGIKEALNKNNGNSREITNSDVLLIYSPDNTALPCNALQIIFSYFKDRGLALSTRCAIHNSGGLPRICVEYPFGLSNEHFCLYEGVIKKEAVMFYVLPESTLAQDRIIPSLETMPKDKAGVYFTKEARSFLQNELRHNGSIVSWNSLGIKERALLLNPEKDPAVSCYHSCGNKETKVIPILEDGGRNNIPEWFEFNGYRLKSKIGQIDLTKAAHLVEYFGIAVNDRVLEIGADRLVYLGVFSALRGAKVDFVQPRHAISKEAYLPSSSVQTAIERFIRENKLDNTISSRSRIIESKLEEADKLRGNYGGYRLITLFNVFDSPSMNENSLRILVTEVIRFIKLGGYIVISRIFNNDNFATGISMLSLEAQKKGFLLVKIQDGVNSGMGGETVIFKVVQFNSKATLNLGVDVPRGLNITNAGQEGCKNKDGGAAIEADYLNEIYSLSFNEPDYCWLRYYNLWRWLISNLNLYDKVGGYLVLGADFVASQALASFNSQGKIIGVNIDKRVIDCENEKDKTIEALKTAMNIIRRLNANPIDVLGEELFIFKNTQIHERFINICVDARDARKIEEGLYFLKEKGVIESNKLDYVIFKGMEFLQTTKKEKEQFLEDILNRILKPEGYVIFWPTFLTIETILRNPFLREGLISANLDLQKTSEDEIFDILQKKGQVFFLL